MKTIEDLKAEIAGLQAEVAKISSEGRVLIGCWIAQAKPGSKKNKYPRLKSRKPIFNGKKTEYLSIQGSAIAEAQAAIQRGKLVKKLNQRIQTLSDRIEELQQKSTKKCQTSPRKASQIAYPPPESIELARQVMGGLDLDPASDEIAQQWVQAANYYTLTQNGLSHPWFGRVWLHPPAPGKPGKWIKKAIAEYEVGNITEAIILVRPSPGSKWFQALMRRFPVCFPDQRICFLDQQGHPQPQPQQSHVFFYLGQNLEQFGQIFRSIGCVSSPI